MIYSAFAHYYDIYAQDYEYSLWFDYLKELSGIKNFAQKRVLDLGCGTGTLLLRFAREGALGTGVDRSEEMLAFADEKLFENRKQARLIHGDIAAFRANEQFDLVYSTFDTVNYLDKSGFEQMLGNISSMLAVGGLFTFDLLNPEYFALDCSDDHFSMERVSFDFHRSLGEGTLCTEVIIQSPSERKTERHVQFFLEEEFIKEAARRQGMAVDFIWDIFEKTRSTAPADKLQYGLRKH